jgi:four helix bundle protein
LADELVLRIHKMSLELPGFEKYEIGSQIRRSIKSVKSNIVEGYGRRRYKKEFIRFIVFSLASNDETLDHLDTLFKTESFKNEIQYRKLREDLIRLGKEINSFLKAVEIKHNNFI